jgi:hypothetical protein
MAGEPVPDLRVHAIVGADFHLDLDLGLTDQQRQQLLELIAEVCRRLSERETVTAAEAASWEVLDGQTVTRRSAAALATSAIAELGEAMIELVRGTLPDLRAERGGCLVCPAGRAGSPWGECCRLRGLSCPRSHVRLPSSENF